MMLGFLLARAGVKAVVLEKHADFLRDFRGDTVHPSTLNVIDELGLLDALEQLERGLLHGIAAQPAIRRLRAELAQEDRTGLDERLRGILGAIEVCGAVELAKRESHDQTD